MLLSPMCSLNIVGETFETAEIRAPGVGLERTDDELAIATSGTSSRPSAFATTVLEFVDRH